MITEIIILIMIIIIMIIIIIIIIIIEIVITNNDIQFDMISFCLLLIFKFFFVFSI